MRLPLDRWVYGLRPARCALLLSFVSTAGGHRKSGCRGFFGSAYMNNAPMPTDGPPGPHTVAPALHSAADGSQQILRDRSDSSNSRIFNCLKELLDHILSPVPLYNTAKAPSVEDFRPLQDFRGPGTRGILGLLVCAWFG